MHYKIFDTHTHAFPQKIAAKTMALLSAEGDIKNQHDGSFNGLKGYEEQGGAAAFLLLPIATKAASVGSINRWVAGKVGNGVYAYGTLHPDCEDMEQEVDDLISLGLTGVKLHPEYQEFYADEERLMPLYEAVFKKDLTVYFHAGEDIGFPPPVRGAAHRIARVAQQFPQGKIIAAHMGGFRQYEEVMEHLAGRSNIWMDTSFASLYMEPEEIVTLVRRHGVDRFFFGTDAPWTEFEKSRDVLLQSGLNPDELQAIFWDNAQAFFGES